MSIKTERLDLIQRPVSGIELDSELESATQDTFLLWTTNEIITQTGINEAYEAPIQSNSEFDSDTPIKSYTRFVYQNKTARK